MKQTVVALAMLVSLTLAGAGEFSDPSQSAGRLVKRCPIGDYECYREDKRTMLAKSRADSAISDYRSVI